MDMEQKSQQENPMKRSFEGGSLEAADKSAELRGREKIGAVRLELDAKVQQEAGAFQESTSSWWSKAKNLFAGAKSFFSKEKDVQALDEKMSGLKAGYQREAEAVMQEAPTAKAVDQMSAAELNAEYEKLAEEVAAEGANEQKLQKKALATERNIERGSSAGNRLNEVYARLNALRAGEKPAPQQAPTETIVEARREDVIQPVTPDMIIEETPVAAEQAGNAAEKTAEVPVDGVIAKAAAVHERIGQKERAYVRKLLAKGDTESLEFSAKTYDNRAAQYEKMSDEEIVANAVELGAISKEDAGAILKSGRSGEIRAAAVASDRKLSAEARGGVKAEEAPVAESAEAPKAEEKETAEGALARMEAGHEKLAMREAELEGMVEIADDIASGKLKKTDLSAAQMLWLEKPGELENARDELANVREARQLAAKQIESRKPKAAAPAQEAAPQEAPPAGAPDATPVETATAEAPPQIAIVDRTAEESPATPEEKPAVRTKETPTPLKASLGDMLAAKEKQSKKPRKKTGGAGPGQISASA